MDIRREDGVALMVAMMAMLLMSALGTALVLTTSSETAIASNFKHASEAFYAADAALEIAMEDLATAPDWNPILSGAVQSAFVDGLPTGSRALADGTTLDLGGLVNLANCNKVTVCSSAEMNAVTSSRPWGLNNPSWQLYAYGNLRNLLPGSAIDSPYYIAVMVADDPSENDGKPLQDGADGTNPGTGIIALRAESFGPRGARKIIEMTVSRTDSIGVRVLSWREVR